MMITRLNWDSDFFNKRVGVLHITSGEKQIDFKELCHFDLVYIILESGVDDTVFHQLPHCVFVDNKVTFKKKASCLSQADHQIFSLKSEEALSDRLIDIAIQSGIYSRFNVDRNIPEAKFRELYTLWIRNSINRSIAKDVLVYKVSDDIAGLVTLGQKNGKADIGLIAVDEKYRGNQIGHKLLLAADCWAKKIMGTDDIQVVTQGANIPACSFYKKNGFSVDAEQKIFHWWNPETNNSFISLTESK